MTSPENLDQRIEVSPEFRDKVWEYLPPIARLATQNVVVQYFSSIEGNPRLILTYGPQTRDLLTISKELIKPLRADPFAGLRSYLVRSVTLHSESGKVKGYWEGSEVRNRTGAVVLPPENSFRANQPLFAAFVNETIHSFTQEKLDYFYSALAGVSGVK